MNRFRLQRVYDSPVGKGYEYGTRVEDTQWFSTDRQVQHYLDRMGETEPDAVFLLSEFHEATPAGYWLSRREVGEDVLPI